MIDQVIFGLKQEIWEVCYGTALEKRSTRFKRELMQNPGLRATRFKYALDRLLLGEIKKGKYPFIFERSQNTKPAICPQCFINQIFTFYSLSESKDHQQARPDYVVGSSWHNYEPLSPGHAKIHLADMNHRSDQGRNRAILDAFEGMTLIKAGEGKNRVRWFQIYGGIIHATINHWRLDFRPCIAQDLFYNWYFRNRSGNWEYLVFPSIMIPLIMGLNPNIKRRRIFRISYMYKIAAYRKFFQMQQE